MSRTAQFKGLGYDGEQAVSGDVPTYLFQGEGLRCCHFFHRGRLLRASPHLVTPSLLQRTIRGPLAIRAWKFPTRYASALVSLFTAGPARNWANGEPPENIRTIWRLFARQFRKYLRRCPE